MGIECVKAICHDCVCRLGRIPMTMMCRVEHPTELVGAMGKPWMGNDMPDKVIGGVECHRKRFGVVIEVLLDKVMALVECQGTVVDIGHHLLVTGVGVDGRYIIMCEWADVEAGCSEGW